MGMFVTGSIIKPRIFISTSIGCLPRLLFDALFSRQAIGTSTRYANMNVFSQKVGARRSKIYGPVARCATGPLRFPPRRALHQPLENLPPQSFVPLYLNSSLALLNNLH